MLKPRQRHVYLTGALRKMGSRGLARRVMSAQGLEPDFRTMCSIEASLQPVLLRLARMGLVKVTGKPRRWAVAN